MKITKVSRYTRFLATVLALLMVLAAFVSCADDIEETPEPDTSEVGEAVTEEETVSPGLTLDTPKMDFGGYTFSVLSANTESLYTLLDVDKITGETVNDAIFNRNRKIEDEYHIKFECTGTEWANTYSFVQKQAKSGDSGDGSYDLIMLICREAYQATINNLLLSYDKLEYVDISKDYYYKNLDTKFSIGNHTFFAYGYDNLNVLCQSGCVVYNKQLLENHGIEDIYGKVDNGEWTLDTLFGYAETASSDIGGDGFVYKSNDIFGLTGDFDLTIPSAWIGTGEYLVSKDADDMPVYSANNERMLSVLQDVVNYFAKDYCSVYTSRDGKDEEFMKNKSVFYTEHLGALYTLRAMEDDYGVVPWPKYNTAQTSYYSRVIDGWLHVVPSSCSNTERTSAIMQALAYYSYDTVYNAYYEQALSAKFVRDEDSVRMIKLILETVQVDLGDTIWYSSMRSPMVDEMRSRKGAIGVSSLITKYEKKCNSEIKKVQKFLDKLS